MPRDNLIAGGICAEFERASLHLGRELIWLPERGMGYLRPPPGAAAVYDDAYFEKYRGYAQTDLGRALTQARIDLVKSHVGALWVCDFGIGCGDFIEQHAAAVGYDIMPAAVSWLRERDRFHDPYCYDAGVLTCWDSLEHVPQPDLLLRHVQGWLFVSLPIFESGERALKSKHFRPDEHFWYWTREGFERWLAELGFDVIESNTIESALGREDIMTFVGRRRDALA